MSGNSSWAGLSGLSRPSGSTVCRARLPSAPWRDRRTRPEGPSLEKSFRETPKPLISLKTAKSGDLRAQEYQDLVKHWISLAKRFRFVFPSFRFARNQKFHFGTAGAGRSSGLKNLEKSRFIENKLFSPPNPLKKLKTAKEMFAKIWRKQRKICKNLREKFGLWGRLGGVGDSPAGPVFGLRRRDLAVLVDALDRQSFEGRPGLGFSLRQA